MDHSNTKSIRRARLCRSALVVGIAASALVAASTGSASAQDGGPASDEQRYEAPSRGTSSANAFEARAAALDSADTSSTNAMEAQVSADTSTTVSISVPCFAQPLNWKLASNGPLPECSIQVAGGEVTAMARPRPSECPAPPDRRYVGVPWAAYTDECPDWWELAH